MPENYSVVIELKFQNSQFTLCH